MLPSNVAPLTLPVPQRIIVEFSQAIIIYTLSICHIGSSDSQTFGGLRNHDVNFAALLQQRLKVGKKLPKRVSASVLDHGRAVGIQLEEPEGPLVFGVPMNRVDLSSAFGMHRGDCVLEALGHGVGAARGRYRDSNHTNLAHVAP
jgi:hypothetical protein